jgi:Ca-activated chloride channel homolog
VRFANWPFLLLLILIPLLHRWWMNRNRPARVRFSLPIPERVSNKNPLRFMLWVKYAGIVLMIFSLARPQFSFRQTEKTMSGIDIVLVMDVSASMNAEDMGARSRIDIAQDMMERFIQGRQNDRLGFVMFSGEPLTLAPLTLDYGLLLRAVHQARIGILKDGTAIGDGLSLAVSNLRNSKAKSKVIVLLTDGDNNVGQVDPATAGALAAGYGIRVYTIAIGREGRVKIPIHHRDAFGNVMTTYQFQDNALNPELLKLIARDTHGKFYRVEDESTLAGVFKEIDQMEKNEMKAKEKIRYEEAYQKPLKLGVLTMLIGQVLEWGWWRFLP